MDLKERLISIQGNAEPGVGAITWYPSKLCNYDCSYCSDLLHDNKSSLLSSEKMDIALHHLCNLDVTKLKLTLSGGEPFLHKHLSGFLHRLRAAASFSLEIGAVTNGSLPSRIYIEASEWMDYLTFSAHLEFVDDSRFLDMLREVRSAADNGFYMRVNLMFLPGQGPRIREFRSRLSEIGIDSVVRKIRARNSSSFLQYSDGELQSIAKSFEEEGDAGAEIDVGLAGEAHPVKIASNQIVSEMANRFKGWKCMAGHRYFTIWNDGQVYPCEPSEGIRSLGDFYSRDFQWPESQGLMTCPVESCVCLGDVLIPKWQAHQ